MTALHILSTEYGSARSNKKRMLQLTKINKNKHGNNLIDLSEDIQNENLHIFLSNAMDKVLSKKERTIIEDCYYKNEDISKALKKHKVKYSQLRKAKNKLKHILSEK